MFAASLFIKELGGPYRFARQEQLATSVPFRSVAKLVDFQ